MKKYILFISLFLNLVFVFFVIRHFVNAPGQIDRQKPPFRSRRLEILSKMPIDSTDVIFAGDSHTLQFQLEELFHSLKVKNRGINSETSDGLLNRADELTKGRPSKIFIEIGVNDLNREPVSYVKESINVLILKIKKNSPRTKIYLESVLPTILLLPKIKELNKLLPGVANSNKITFIDLDPYFMGNGLKEQYDSGDRLHLNGEGYLEWRDVLLKYFNE